MDLEQYLFALDHYEFQTTDVGGVVVVAIMKNPDDDHTMAGSIMGKPLLPKIESKEQFELLVNKLRTEGWLEDKYIARQIVDDNYKHTGANLLMQQHIVEHMVSLVPWENTEDVPNISGMGRRWNK